MSSLHLQLNMFIFQLSTIQFFTLILKYQFHSACKHSVLTYRKIQFSEDSLIIIQTVTFCPNLNTQLEHCSLAICTNFHSAVVKLNLHPFPELLMLQWVILVLYLSHFWEYPLIRLLKILRNFYRITYPKNSVPSQFPSDT